MRAKVCIALAQCATAALLLQAPLAAQFVYVANWGSHDISGYSMNASTGALTPIPGSPFAAAGNPQSVAVHPTGKFVYATGYFDVSGISGYTVDAQTGALSPLPGSPFNGLSPYEMVIHPSGRFAYVTTGTSAEIWVYSISQTNGSLTVVQRFSTAGAFVFRIALDPSGSFAYVTHDPLNELNGSIFGFTIDAGTGMLTQTFVLSGSEVTPRSVTVHPSGKFLYVGNGRSNNVLAFTINPQTGFLTDVPGSPFHTAAFGTEAVAVNPAGTFLYSANVGSNNVSAFGIDKTTGVLAPVPGSPFGAGSNPVWVAVEQTGRFAYVANLGSANVSGYAIDPGTGAPGNLPGSPFPAGNMPMQVAIAHPSCTPPVIDGVAADPSVLWPPNHQFVPVTVRYNVTGGCSTPACTLHVASSEPAREFGIVLGPRQVLLRAERDGNGSGRVYAITVTCNDSSGNSSSKAVAVTVPHNR